MVLPKFPWWVPTHLGFSWVPITTTTFLPPPALHHTWLTAFPLLRRHLQSNMASGLENVGLGQTGHIRFHWGTSWALVFLRSLTRDGETHSGPINQLESLKKYPKWWWTSQRGNTWCHESIITNRERWQEPWRKRSERKKPYQEMVRQGSLECCTSRGFRVRHDWVTEQHKELDAKFSFPLNTQRTRAEFISSFPEYIPLSQPENFKNCKSYKAGLGLLFRWMPRLKWWEQGWYILKKANDMISNYTEDIQLVNSTLKTLKNHESLGKCSKTNWKLRDSSTHLLKGLILTIGTDVEKLELLQCRWKRKGEQSF